MKRFLPDKFFWHDMTITLTLAVIVAATMFVVGIAGCGAPSEPKPEPVEKVDLPPVFNYGDMVVPLGGTKLCIVTVRTRNQQRGKWIYTVMHQDHTFDYDENQLKLFNHFDWDMDPDIDKILNKIEAEIRAEVESDEEINW